MVSVALAVFELLWLLSVVASVIGRFGNFQWFSVVSVIFDRFRSFRLFSAVFICFRLLVVFLVVVCNFNRFVLPHYEVI